MTAMNSNMNPKTIEWKIINEPKKMSLNSLKKT
jgi:hypothetical protein